MALHTFKARIISNLPLALLFIFAFALVYYYSSQTKVFGDEHLILLPAEGNMSGQAYPLNSYPPFSYMFYELFFRLLYPFRLAIAPINIARFINNILFAVNVLLLYRVARYYLEKSWAFLASFFFMLTPVVFFSGVMVKTESLLLAEVLICAISAHKILSAPDRVVWHIVAAIACATSFTTKCNIFVPAIYCTAVLLAGAPEKSGSLPARLVALLRSRNVWIFAAVFIATILITWPGLLHITLVNLKDIREFYFQEGPQPMRAVGELFSFPYGMFSYSLTTVIPLAAGFCIYIFAILAIPLRAVPRQLLIIGGVYVLLYCVIMQIVTLDRIPHLFIPVMPFLVLFGVFFLRCFFAEGKKQFFKIAGVILVSASVAVSIIQYPTYWLMWDTVIDSLLEAAFKADKVALLFHGPGSRNYGVDPMDIEGSIEKIKPTVILTNDSYFQNYGKHKNPLYQRQYEYYKRLREGKAGYTIEWRRKADIPFEELYFDPEIPWQLTLFRRNDKVKK